MRIITDHKCGASLCGELSKYLYSKGIIAELSIFYLFNVSKYNPKEKYLLVVRNPREVIVSGMLYHRKVSRKREGWIHGGNYFAGYDRFFSHRDKKKYKKYLDLALVDHDYQATLNAKSDQEALEHEMDNIGLITLTGMNIIENRWGNKPNVLIINFEDLVWDLENTLNKCIDFFKWHNIKNDLIDFMKEYSLVLKGKEVHKDHITNLELDKYRYKKYWNDILEQKLKKIYFHIL